MKVDNMKEIIKPDYSKVNIDCLGVLCLDSNTEYINDFRRNLLSKVNILERFINADLT